MRICLIAVPQVGFLKLSSFFSRSRSEMSTCNATTGKSLAWVLTDSNRRMHSGLDSMRDFALPLCTASLNEMYILPSLRFTNCGTGPLSDASKSRSLDSVSTSSLAAVSLTVTTRVEDSDLTEVSHNARGTEREVNALNASSAKAIL